MDSEINQFPGNRWCIALVDDEVSVRQMLSHVFESAGLLCQSYESAESLLQSFDTYEYGCFVIDLELPGIGGLELQTEIRSRCAEVPVVVISGTARVRDVIDSYSNGTRYFFEKPFDCEDLLEKVRSLAEASIAFRSRYLEIESRLRHLSLREREVMHLLIAGDKTVQIARKLQISPSTVEKHRLRIFDKTGTSSVVELIHCMPREGDIVPCCG